MAVLHRCGSSFHHTHKFARARPRITTAEATKTGRLHISKLLLNRSARPSIGIVGMPSLAQHATWDARKPHKNCSRDRLQNGERAFFRASLMRDKLIHRIFAGTREARSSCSGPTSLRKDHAASCADGPRGWDSIIFTISRRSLPSPMESDSEKYLASVALPSLKIGACRLQQPAGSHEDHSVRNTTPASLG